MAEEEIVEEKKEQTETTKTTKKTLSQKVKEHPWAVFWIRLVLWVIMSAIAPFLFIAFRYGLFKDSASLSGWGLVGLVILAVFVIALIRSVSGLVKGKHPFISQCIKGFCSIIIPLLILYVVIEMVNDSTATFMQCLGCVILCELVGIPLNPLPELAWKNQQELKEAERKDTIDYFVGEWFNKKKNGDKE